MKNFLELLQEKGTTFMLVGLSVIIVFAVLEFGNLAVSSTVKNAVLICGVAIYALGRLGVFLYHKNRRENRTK